VRRSARLLARGALVAALASSVPAIAAPPLAGTASVADRAKARRATQEGEAKLAKGDLEGALERFLYAAGVVPSGQTFRQIATLHDRLGHVREAVAAYEAYLELAPQREIAEAKARVSELKKTPGRVVLRGSPREARLTVDDEQSFEGLPVELLLAPGEHRFVLAAEGYVAHEFVVEVAFGSESSPAVDLERAAPFTPPAILEDLEHAAPVLLPAPPPAAPAPPSAPSWAARHPGALTLSGLTLGALGAGVFFGLEAIDAQRTFGERPSSADADRGERAAFHADLAFGGALLLGAAAVALIAHDETAPATALSVQTAPIARHAGTSRARAAEGF
jgi:tetratricopeptide (TPR) repeat protein